MTLDEIVAEYENNVADLTTSERLLVWVAYETGLRRAQELANDLVGTHFWGQLDHDEFNQAIDAEAKK